ncbi:beta-lactamase family protein [Catenulispora sp. NF23]|uniref:serine hydrolase domain-containing protein n=1 Tax=Catenulispora pinistramenti TaxID=2705254 RepID=UPI001BABB46F|nr:serine hydrolase domain-containing protein [Catenulispora pinistramenti]MBS2532994.1 beta-lactamase family protein [Catenulispora pinistramenti]
MTQHADIHGTVAPGFEAVRTEFTAIAAGQGAEYPAQVAAYRDGARVVDLWTGPDTEADTLFGAYSASKGAVHLVVALLVQEGVLDYDQKVSHYWPEFAVQGKRDLTLRELTAHRAGLVGADTGFTLEELADDQVVAERLGAQRPYWRPGTAFGYHALVMGALSGEVVRRVTGRGVQELFTERITDAHDVDFRLGLPAALEPRFRPTLPMYETPERLAELARTAKSPTSVNGIAFNRTNPHTPQVWELPNHQPVRTLGTASFGGVASARGLAKMYAVAISAVDGAAPLLAPATIAEVGQIQSFGPDVVLGMPRAFTVGFHATSEYYPQLGQGSFGHSGAGGQQAFADPRNGIAYGYTRGRMPFPAAPGPENDRLIAAIYGAGAALGR